MSLLGTTVLEVQTGGSDTLNSGGFDTVVSGKSSSGAVSSANTSAPVFSNAFYNFVAGDVGNWVYIVSGTNSIPGWYKIASVASNNATLDAAIGHAVLANGTPNTVVGCGTAASLTSQTWAVDYSQQAGVQFSLTGLTTAAANAIILTSAATTAMIGNLIQITGGTNFTAGVYTITTVSIGVSITVDRTCTTAAGAAGTAGIGGAYASPGFAESIATVAAMQVYIKSGTYSITSASSNVAGGVLTVTSNTIVEGYGTVRGDLGTPPILQASGISSCTLITANGSVSNITVDGASLSTVRGFTAGSGNGQAVYLCTAKNCTNTGFTCNGTYVVILCYATGCTTQPAFSGIGFWGCVANSNSVNGFTLQNNGAVNAQFCISSNNTGIGFQMGTGGLAANCIAYANTSDGFKFSGAGNRTQIIGCIAVNNSGYGFNLNAMTAGNYATLRNNFGYNNTSNNLNGTVQHNATPVIAGSADPFNNAAGLDFSLNAAAGGGLLCRAAGIPGAYLGLSTTGFMDIGAVQHQDQQPVIYRRQLVR